MCVAKLWAFFNPLTKFLIVSASFVKLHLFALGFESEDVGCNEFLCHKMNDAWVIYEELLILVFLAENLSILNLDDIISNVINDIMNDIIHYLKSYVREVIGSMVHNTAWFHWVYINSVVDCALILRHYLLLSLASEFIWFISFYIGMHITCWY